MIQGVHRMCRMTGVSYMWRVGWIHWSRSRFSYFTLRIEKADTSTPNSVGRWTEEREQSVLNRSGTHSCIKSNRNSFKISIQQQHLQKNLVKTSCKASVFTPNLRQEFLNVWQMMISFIIASCPMWSKLEKKILRWYMGWKVKAAEAKLS